MMRVYHVHLAVFPFSEGLLRVPYAMQGLTRPLSVQRRANRALQDTSASQDTPRACRVLKAHSPLVVGPSACLVPLGLTQIQKARPSARRVLVVLSNKRVVQLNATHVRLRAVLKLTFVCLWMQ